MRRSWFCFLVLVSLLGGSAYAGSETYVTILTGSTSGVYYPLGNALASIFMKAIPEARASVEVTEGSVENLRLIEAGDGELAFSLGDSASAAWKGIVEAGFPKPLTKLRTLAAIYPNYVQLVASKASNVVSLADLKGKRVSVGPRQSGTELNARAILGAAGLKYSDFAQVLYLPFGQSAKMMEKGELDATLQSAGLGVDSIRHLSSSVPITIVPIPPQVVARIGDPAYVARKIPARTYEGQVEDVETAAIVNFLITREGLATDLVYAMTKAMFENLDLLAQTHPAASGIDREAAAARTPIPLHPGAERYYREAGLLR